MERHLFRFRGLLKLQLGTLAVLRVDDLSGLGWHPPAHMNEKARVPFSSVTIAL